MTQTVPQNGSTALTVREPARIDAPITDGEIDTLYRLAKGLAMSGFFKDAQQAEQAFAKLIFGRDLGLGATQAMTDIHIVEGKPEMSANLHASKVLASGRYDYTVVKLDDKECEITFERTTDGKQLGVSTFTLEDAQRAGLVGRGADMYTKYVRNMLFARAMTNGVAWFCPDVFNGVRVYAEGEVRETLPAGKDEPPVAEVEPASLGDAVVAALRKGIEIAGLDDAMLSMWLVDLDCEDVGDPLAALSTLDAARAEALDRRLSEHVTARDAEQPADVEVEA